MYYLPMSHQVFLAGNIMGEGALVPFGATAIKVISERRREIEGVRERKGRRGKTVYPAAIVPRTVK